MSYYDVNPSYFQNPPPPYGPTGDRGSAVPGWGVARDAAGPERVGVGADIPDIAFVCPAQAALFQEARQLYPGNDAMQTGYILAKGAGFAGNWQAWCAQQPIMKTSSDTMPGPAPAPAASGTGGIPWWVWVAAPVAVGGLLALAYEMEWIGKKR